MSTDPKESQSSTNVNSDPKSTITIDEPKSTDPKESQQPVIGKSKYYDEKSQDTPVQSKVSLVDIDKKITIKEKKDKNKNKTYVSGIEAIDEFATKKGVDELTKTLKMLFGCGGNIESDTKTKRNVMVLHGNHKEKLLKYFKTKYPKIQIT